jgi:hypothetical protein
LIKERDQKERMEAMKIVQSANLKKNATKQFVQSVIPEIDVSYIFKDDKKKKDGEEGDNMR